MEVPPNPGLQDTPRELNRVQIRRIGKQILYLTALRENGFFDSRVTMRTRVIHDNDAVRPRISVPVR
jgi:hypothetical protein